MALVRNPVFSTEASGNVCGINFTRWRGLAVARCAWSGTVPNTTLQVEQQDILIIVAGNWGNLLTTAQRNTYTESAKQVRWTGRLGDPYIPNGYQLFMKLNIRRLVIGLGVMLTAPPVQEWVYVHDMTAASVPGAKITVKLRSHASGTLVQSYGVEYYRAGPYVSGGRRPIDGEWRFKSRKVPPAQYVDTDVNLNEWYWYRARQISEFGDVGNWFEIQKQNS